MTLQHLPGGKIEIVPYRDWKTELVGSYDSVPHDRDNYRNACIGGSNFARTLDLVLDRTEDHEAAMRVYDALKTIAKRPNAGTTSWQMRRCIRYAPTDMIKEFCELVKQEAEIDPKFGLDMDFYWFDVQGADVVYNRYLTDEVLDGFKHRIERRKNDPSK